MNCPKCGTENPNDAKSCWFCSSILTPVSPSGFVQSAKTSGLAIASLVLGILAPLTCFLTAIPAIIFGIVGLVKIGKSTGQLKGNGLAIAGICVSGSGTLLALLPIFALMMGMMMGIMMPALAKTRQVAFRMVCAQNLSALGKAMHIYANDYNDMFPTPSKWCDLLIEHNEVSKQTFRCPCIEEGPCSYAMNINIEKLGTNAPPGMVLLFETHPGWNQAGGFEILTTDNHKSEGCNILFVDGHVEFVRTAGLKNLRWSEKEDKIAPLESPPLLPPPSPPPLRVVPLTGVKGNEKGAPEPNQ